MVVCKVFYTIYISRLLLSRVFQQVACIAEMGHIANHRIRCFDHVPICSYDSITMWNTFQWWVECIIEAFRNRNGSLRRMVGDQQI